MTPEQRFERIETNLDRMGDRMDRMGERMDQLTDRVDRMADRMDQMTDIVIQQQLAIDKNTAAIRDLVQVSRTLLDSVGGLTTKFDELREAQKQTDQRLDALIKTVDRLVNWQKPNGQQ